MITVCAAHHGHQYNILIPALAPVNCQGLQAGPAPLLGHPLYEGHLRRREASVKAFICQS